MNEKGAGVDAILVKQQVRPSKIEANLLIAHDIALRSPCTRRKFGAIIVKDDCIISSGYNGSVRGSLNCGIDCPCLKDINQEASIKSYDHCPAVHGEMNSIINAARRGVSVEGGTMFLDVIFGSVTKRERPCFLCRRFMIQAGIKDIYFYGPDGKIVHEEVVDYVKMENEWIEAQKIPEVNSECQNGPDGKSETVKANHKS
jgi:dCMP deaminase